MKEPAEIVRALGGPSKVAALTGVHRTRVHSWMRDTIPVKHWPALIEEGERRGVVLSANDFLPQRGAA